MVFFSKKNYDNFKNNGYVLLEGYFNKHIDELESITQHFSTLPIEQIRKLTKKELKYHENNEYWNLPQNFYQS